MEALLVMKGVHKLEVEGTEVRLQERMVLVVLGAVEDPMLLEQPEE